MTLNGVVAVTEFDSFGSELRHCGATMLIFISLFQLYLELLELVWPLCQGIGTVEQADRVTPGFGPSNLTLHHSTLG